LSSEPLNSEPEEQSSSDWRDELKRRIEAHQLRKEDPQSEQPDAGPAQASDHSAAGSAASPARWDSNDDLAPLQSETEGLDHAGQAPDDPPPDDSGPLIESLQEPAQEPLSGQSGFENGEDLPASGSSLIERSLDPASEVPSDSRRQIVTFSEKATPALPPLESNIQATAGNASNSALPSSAEEDALLAEEDFPDDDLAAGKIDRVPREIFLSRLLAGLVDLLLSAFFGLVFGWVASALLGFDFFSPATIEIGAATGLFFYWASSLFFLLLSGQTPGMHLTGLQLLYQESTELPFMAALIRVIFILPVIATVAGLLWGFFDPWGRCLHDRLSQTRVVPIPEEPQPQPAQLFE